MSVSEIDALNDEESSGFKTASRQRIFQRNKQRIAIRLEEDYWTTLDACAKERGVKVSDLVFDAIDGTGPHGNRTAQLRVFCLGWLRERLAQVGQAESSFQLQTILSACPSPCVIMTKEKAIVAYNSAFAHAIIGKLSPEEGTDASGEPLTFKLETPLETIHTELLAAKTRFHETSAAFLRQQKMVSARARFCLLDAGKGKNSPLLCYLMAFQGGMEDTPS